MSKLANVTVERLEQRPPGAGVPAGWMPEVIYHVTVKDIPHRPEKPEYVTSLRPKARYLLRSLSVAPQDANDWELMISMGLAGDYLGASVVCPRTGCWQFGESPCWPPAAKPVTISRGEEIYFTLWRRSVAISKRFECILRGAEDSVLPAGEERSILKDVKL